MRINTIQADAGTTKRTDRRLARYQDWRTQMVKLHEQGFPVFAEEGEVQIDAAFGLTSSLTPLAAKETAERLVECAKLAERQSDEDTVRRTGNRRRMPA
jgi:hypothetical protein